MWKYLSKSLFGVSFAASVAISFNASSEPLAKDLFGSKKLPAAIEPAAHGFYSKGCFSGGLAMAKDGPHWQAMRLSRNRRWGHPELIKVLTRLSVDANRDGWNGLLVGDLSQPRGGPMLTGHASHQIGLDADIWLTPMPNRRYTDAERENVSAISMLKEGTLYVDDSKWTKAHEALLRNAASYSNVERLLVHPGIKKKLCDTVTGDRSWLRKVRPYWGHHYHVHIRIGCPADSPNCKPQSPPPRGTGCDQSLAWWFTDEPWKPAPKDKPQKPRARDVMTMAALPNACRVVLGAPEPVSEAAVTVDRPDVIPANATRAAAAEHLSPAEVLRRLSSSEVPVPSPRP